MSEKVDRKIEVLYYEVCELIQEYRRKVELDILPQVYIRTIGRPTETATWNEKQTCQDVTAHRPLDRYGGYSETHQNE